MTADQAINMLQRWKKGQAEANGNRAYRYRPTPSIDAVRASILRKIEMVIRTSALADAEAAAATGGHQT